MKQTHASNCGPAALMTLCELIKRPLSESIEEIEQSCGTTAESGTSPEGMVEAALMMGFETRHGRSKKVEELNPPCIVNYFKIDDGHYSVVIEIDRVNRKIVLDDPEEDSEMVYDFDEFDSMWFSERYGKKFWMEIV